MQIYLDDTVLRLKAVMVTDPVEKGLFKAMIGLMHTNKGIGLAAPQIGLSLRLFVTDVKGDKPRMFINPTITDYSDDTCKKSEGCLSVPGVFKDVERPARVKVTATDLKGREFTLECGGMLARCIQHEYDHLDGILFIEKAR